MRQLQNSLFLVSFNHLPKVAAALCLALALGACSSDSGDDDDGSGGSTAGSGGDTTGSGGSTAGSGGSTAGSGGSTAGSGGSTAGSSGGTSCVSCDGGCPNIPCQCQDGSIVNTTFCNNGCCQPKEIACPDACSDSGGWVSGSGGSGGGNAGTGGTGGSSGSTANPIGGECQGDPDCASKICLFKTGAAFGYCSKLCEDWTDCPDFWDCSAVGNASGTYCVQD
jgi:hypothetical protein